MKKLICSACVMVMMSSTLFEVQSTDPKMSQAQKDEIAEAARKREPIAQFVADRIDIATRQRQITKMSPDQRAAIIDSLKTVERVNALSPAEQIKEYNERAAAAAGEEVHTSLFGRIEQSDPENGRRIVAQYREYERDQTPLYRALVYGKIDIEKVKSLIAENEEKNGDAGVNDLYGGYSLLYWMLHLSNVVGVDSQSFIEVIELFADNGFDFNATRIFEKTYDGTLPPEEERDPDNEYKPYTRRHETREICLLLGEAVLCGTEVANALVAASEVNASTLLGNILRYGGSYGIEKYGNRKKAGLLPVVQFLLNKKTVDGRNEINVTEAIDDPDGFFDSHRGYVTYLYLAAKHGHLDVVKFLLTCRQVRDGINETSGRDENTPLYAAAEQGHLEVVKLLLANGAVVNTPTTDGLTPLYGAALSGNSEIVQLLLTYKEVAEKVHEKCGSYENTPLYAAALSGNPEIVRLLLTYKKVAEKVHEKCGGGCIKNTPLYAAAVSGNPEIVQLLLGYPGVQNIINEKCGLYRETPLYAAAVHGHLEVVKLLLANGALKTINEKCRYDKNTPLYAASGRGHLEVVKLLLANGALKTTNEKCNGETPLYAASGGGHLEVVKLLLANGALKTINEKCTGETPLSAAAGNGNLEVVELLLSYPEVKGRIDEKCDGNTPLYAAAWRGHLEVVKLLLANGALKTINEKCRCDKNTPLYAASDRGHLEVVELLLAKGALKTINEKCGGRDGNTPLYAAAEHGHLKVVELLLKSGALKTINEKCGGRYGNTPLCEAAVQCHLEVVELLLANDAIVDEKTLQIAEKRSEEVGYVYTHLQRSAKRMAKAINKIVELLNAAWQRQQEKK